MDNLNKISGKLIDQLENLETDMEASTERLENIKSFVNCRIKKLKKLIPIMCGSKDWMDRLSIIVDLFGEIQTVIDKMGEIDNSVCEIPFEDKDLIELIDRDVEYV